jgi:hypothetical protein
VVFEYQLPSKGKAGALEISVDVTDVKYNSVTSSVVINTEKASSGGAGGGGQGRNR